MSIVNVPTNYKPCPFCGESDVSVDIESDRMGRIASVSCEICGATVWGLGVMVGDDTDESLRASAMNAWNTRTQKGTP